jgi:hypothetical protein
MVAYRMRSYRFPARSLLVPGLLILTAVLAGGLGAAVGSGRPPAGPADERLRALLTQRYEVLQQMVKNTRAEVEAGHATTGALRDLLDAMYRAQADLCPTPAERVQVFEKLVEVLTAQEKITLRQAEAGFATPTQVAESKLARLNAQIDLERLRLATAAPQP